MDKESLGILRRSEKDNDKVKKLCYKSMNQILLLKKRFTVKIKLIQIEWHSSDLGLVWYTA